MLAADEIARVLRRDDDDRLAVGAVDTVNLAENGQRGVRFGNRLAEDDFAQLGEIDRARCCCAQSPSARRQLGAVALSTIYPGSLSSAAFEAFFPSSEPPEASPEAFFCSEEETLSCVPERGFDGDGQAAVRRGVYRRHGDDEQTAFDFLPARASAQRQAEKQRYEQTDAP